MVNHLRGLSKSRFFRALGRVFRTPDRTAGRVRLKPRRLALEPCEQRQLLSTVGTLIGNGAAGSIVYHGGDAVTLDVAITSQGTQVTSFDLAIDYDPTRLTVSSPNSPNYAFGGDVTNLTSWTGTCDTSFPGQIWVSLSDLGQPAFASNSVNVFQLTFHVPPGNTLTGGTPLTFDAGSDIYVNRISTPLAAVNSSIDVLAAGSNTILIRRNASDPTRADVFLNNSPTPAASPLISDLSQPQWNLVGGAGDDQLTVDLSNGDPLPQSSAGGLTYNGGGYVAGNQLVLADSSPGSHGTWLLSTGHASLSDGAALNYSNVQTVCLDGSAASINSSDAIPDSTALTLKDGATLNLNSHTEVVGAVTLQSGQISNGTLSSSGAGTVSAGTISASLSGTGGLTKNTAGTVTLVGNDNYTGGTAVSQGLLVSENSSAIPTGSLLSVGANGSVVLGTPGAAEPLGLGYPGGGSLASSAATVDPSASGSATVQSVTTSDSSTADGLVSGSSSVAQTGAAGAGSAATASVDVVAPAVVLSGANQSSGDSALSAVSISASAAPAELTAAAAAATPARPIQTTSKAAPRPSFIGLFPAVCSQNNAVDRWSAAPAPQSIPAIVALASENPSLVYKPQPSAAYAAWQQATDEVLAGGLQATSNEAVTQSRDHEPLAGLPSLDRLLRAGHLGGSPSEAVG
jgi:autotransporter-associated beta strand protein